MGLFDSIANLSPVNLLGKQINDKTGATDQGNVFQGPNADPNQLRNIAMDGMSNQQTYNGDPTKDVQSNPMLSGMFGAGGTMDRTNAEEQRLASTGYQLTPEDHEAYGQASGDIARQFGQSDQSLAQALSDRGMSNSGAAGAAFTGSQGNKMEQLAGLQTNIAQKRMEMNNQRLNQTRNFLSNLGVQANNDINSAQQRGIGKADAFNKVQNNRYDMSMGLLGKQQGQSNTQLTQQQQTAHPNDLMQGLTGAMSMGSALGGMPGMGPAKAPPGGMSNSPTSAGPMQAAAPESQYMKYNQGVV